MSERQDGANGGVDIAAKVRFLSRPESYPEGTAAVQVIETHMSWVFITDDLVYKLKKPVRLPFLDFSTLARRRHVCNESVRLNQRLAPGVYLAVVPLTVDPAGRLHVAGRGRIVEWLEKMRRLPRERMLDLAIAEGALTESDVRRFAAVLARFYQKAEPVPVPARAFRRRLSAAVADNRRALEEPALGLDRGRLERIAAGLTGFLQRETALLDSRLDSGRVIEAHGDLRPEHVCLLDEPVFIDCLEFDRNLRVMDVADELAYLAMECELEGADFVGPLLFETYQQITGDTVASRLIAFYQCARGLLRAKLSAWHLPDYPPETHERWLRQADGYLTLADRRLIDFV